MRATLLELSIMRIAIWCVNCHIGNAYKIDSSHMLARTHSSCKIAEIFKKKKL